MIDARRAFFPSLVAVFTLTAGASALPLAPCGAVDEGERDPRLYVTALKKPNRLPGGRLNWVLMAIDPRKDDAQADLSGTYSAAIARSRDGRSFAWINIGDHGAIWVRNAKGAEQRIFDPGPWEDAKTHIAFSPDGKELVVSRGEMHRGRDVRDYKTWRMKADGTNCVEMPIPKTDCVHDWSPDGKSLLADSADSSTYNDDPNWHIVLYDRDGKNPRRLMSGGCFLELRYSPDGQRIAFVGAVKDRRTAAGVMAADGSGLRFLFDETDANHRAASNLGWSLDGKSLSACVHEMKKVQLPGGQVVMTIGDEWIEILGLGDPKPRRIKLPEGYILGRPCWY